MNRMIVAVGGTGQLVLHRYLQFYLLGLVNKPFRAVAVDTDGINSPISNIKSFLELLQYGPDPTSGLGTELPEITLLRPKAEDGESLLHVLTGHRTVQAQDVGAESAYFSANTLEQNLMHGLFARPAMSAMITQTSLRNTVLRPLPNTAVIIVGSMIGGTGGGLLVPLIDTIYSFQKREVIDKVRIRGAFFRPYFIPRAGRLADDAVRFLSNEHMVVRTMDDKLRMLHSFYVVGGEQKIDRDPDLEKIGKNLPWPKVVDPIWNGAQATEHLLEETTTEARKNLSDKQLESVPGNPAIEAAATRLNWAIAMIGALIEHEPIAQMSRESYVDTIWGAAFREMVVRFWGIAIQQEGYDRALKEFTVELQKSLRAIWLGSGNEFALSHAFPTPENLEHVRPEHFRTLPWPKLDAAAATSKSLFEGPGKTAERLAANLIFWILRKGAVR